MNEIKKKPLLKVIGWGGFFLLLGAAFIIGILYDKFEYVQFENLLPEEIRNQKVEFNIYDAYGCAMESKNYNEKTKIQMSSDLYYVILTGDLDAEMCSYMCIKIPGKYESALEQIVDVTYNNGLAEVPFHGYGRIHKFSSEEKSYFDDFFTEAGWTSDDIAVGTIPYYIEFQSESMFAADDLFPIGLGIVFVVISLFILIRYFSGAFLKNLKKDIEQAGISEEQFLEDYHQGESLAKKDAIVLGRYCVYTGMNTIWPRAMKIQNVLWAHQKVTTHRRNFIKVGTTYQVVVYDVNRRSENIDVKNEAQAVEILKKMGEKYPWMVLGYSDELNNLYNGNIEAFKSLKYNTTDKMAV